MARITDNTINICTDLNVKFLSEQSTSTTAVHLQSLLAAHGTTRDDYLMMNLPTFSVIGQFMKTASVADQKIF